MLAAGESFPQIALADETGSQVRTHDLLGGHLVLWFYPKDDTPG